MQSAAFVYSLVVVVSFGLANAVSKEITQKFGALRGTVLRNAAVVPLLCVTLFVLKIPPIANSKWIGFGVLIAFGGYLGFVCFMLSIKLGKVGVVVPVASASVLVSSVFGYLFLGDAPGSIKVATLLLVFIGVTLASVSFTDFRNSDILTKASGVPYALLCALLWGISFPLYKFPSDHLGALYYGLIIEVVVLGGACLQIALTPKFESTYSMKGLWPSISARMIVLILVASVGTALGTVFLNLAYQTGEVTLVSAIYGSSSVVALFGGAVLYGEVLTRQQYLGAALVTLGILFPLLFVS